MRALTAIAAGFALVMGVLAPAADVAPALAQTLTIEDVADTTDGSVPATDNVDDGDASGTDDADASEADGTDGQPGGGDTTTGNEEIVVPDADTAPPVTIDDLLKADVLDAGGPMLLSVPDFNADTNVYYALDRQNTWVGSGFNWEQVHRVRIRQMSFNTTNSTPVAQANIVMGGQRDLRGISGRVANALGVTSDGVFYFTTQEGTDSRSGTVDVWRYEMMAMPGSPNPGGICWNNAAPSGSMGEGWACAPQRMVSNLSLNSQGGGTIVGGAVNPRDGAFYFMYFGGTPSGGETTSNPYGEGNVRAHLYRYDQNRTTIGQPVAGEVAHFDIRKHSDFASSYNGDIAFDAVGNLLLTVSNNGGNNSRGRAMLATLNYSQFGSLPTIQWTDSNTPSVPTLLPASTVGAFGQTERFNPLNSSGVNGLAYTATGQLAMEQGESQVLTNPATFEQLGNARTNPVVSGDFVDLASSTSPPVLTVQKFVEGERFAEGDQFVLSGHQKLSSADSPEKFDPVTTTGSAAGLQSQQIGPLPLLSGGEIMVKEDITEHAANYSSSYDCFIELPNGERGDTFASGKGREVTFNYLEVPGATTGPQQMKCIFTNGPLRPDLETLKSSVPESTTTVKAGELVQYKLTFDNEKGLADATVDHVDHLADVLDDADIVDGSIRYGDGMETEYPTGGTAPLENGVTAEYSAGNERITITGTVPTAAVRTVWFEVEVKANDADRPAASSGDAYVLNNFLRPSGETPPTDCVVDDPNCTTNPIEAWTVSKQSQPPNHAWLHSGGNVYYMVDVTKVGALDTVISGIQIVDDMSEVMGVARMDPDAPDYGPQYVFDVKTYDAAGAQVRSFADATAGNAWDNNVEYEQSQLYPKFTGEEGVTKPTDAGWKWTTTLPTFTLRADEVRAQIVYVVEVGGAAAPGNPTAFQMDGDTVAYPPPVLEPFINTVASTSTDLPPNECVLGDDAPTDPQCQVTHTVATNYFHIQKNSTERDADGNTVWNLTGVEFELRDATLASGWPADSPSADLCWSNYAAKYNESTEDWTPGNPLGTYSAGAEPDWGPDSATHQSIIDYNTWALANDKPTVEVCGLFYALESNAYGQAAGTWHGRDIAEGDYELVETKAPEGHQLFAEPIPFVVGDAETEHQLYLPDPQNPGQYLARCTNPNQLPSNGTEACVMQTGWLMQVYDTKLQALPLTGGPSIIWYSVGGALVLLIGGLGAAWLLISRRRSNA